MFGTIANIFKIPDLRNKVLFTLALLCIYRIGFHIPVPGFDSAKMIEMASQRGAETPMGRVAEYLQMFSGGTLSKSSLFGLGIMPYITSSIIFMLLGEIIPALRKLRQEGQTGHKKIQEYTRYLAVPICVPNERSHSPPSRGAVALGPWFTSFLPWAVAPTALRPWM